MKKIFALICLLISTNAIAADVFVLTDVFVSSVGENAIEAQSKAVEIGKKQAFTMLVNKIVDAETPVQLEDDIDISTFVQDVSLSEEKMSPYSYKGNLTVRFKAEPIRNFLMEKGAKFLTSLPEPMLLIPVYEDETRTLLFSEENPILTYWNTEKPSFELFQIKSIDKEGLRNSIAQKTSLDNLSLTYEKLANQYGVSSALVLHIKKAGERYEIRTMVLPENSASQAHIVLSLTDDRPVIEKVIKDLVLDAFRNMQKKWVYLSTKTATPIELYHLVTPVSKMSDLKRIKDKIQQLNFAEKIEIKGFKNRLLSVDVAFRGDLDELEQKLKLNQMRIESYGVSDTEVPLFLLTEISDEEHQSETVENENMGAPLDLEKESSLESEGEAVQLEVDSNAPVVESFEL